MENKKYQKTMIKAKDFRIGNLIRIKDDADYEITGLNQNRVHLNSSPPTHWDASNISGIELSEEWLIKFGFEKINHITEGIIYKKEWLRFTGLHSIEWRGGYIKNKPTYVHQLQNLYYCLTGNELEIK